MTAVIFDFDGVIYDSFSNFYDFLNNVSKKLGNKNPYADKEMLREYYYEPFLEFLLHLSIDWNKNQAMLREEYEIQMLQKGGDIAPGMKKLLQELSKLAKIAIASNTYPNIIERKIDNFGIGPLISAYVSGHEIHKFKPDPQILQLCMERINAKPKETFFVGDMTTDIEAAKRAGCKSIAVTWGYMAREKLIEKYPDFLVTSPEQILLIIQQHVRGTKKSQVG